MSEAVARILEQIDSLSDAERAEIAQAVLEKLGPAEEGDPAEFDAALNRRVDRILSGEVIGIPADQVFDDLRRGRQ